ncbi:lysophosphatidic acid receptor 6 [Pleuronectes platessa]|uniref:lysophosphatidic acid receptor 6 n=1 Tax=Pleuronectes platessa TaxID=8262 RepID=UPI00232A0A37|nr:lysophosphatidic acid receptor 6 [Pleuronectes platessa]XP_053281802.1 lysophosphatidic acid receptor 6 [Pleuronectes platessa]XP_053281804.1 lysophosphatidic acid receptor 6 [Pleuronectes platessa]XP_053281805.1 lysophosphatidic acid receptor 6 [Pleuronectes platessa]XP_053281806.1 lysophosphatidic acid receptor 6 [Pleuronectes platessa]
MNVTDTSCSPDSAEYQYSLFPVIYILALVVGLPGNLAALFVFTFKITPRTAFSVFISNLALVDILILCTLPFRIHYHLNRNNWVFGDIACRITGVLFYSNIYMSICLMTCICVDRYMATVHPHAYQRQRRPWRSLAVCVALWCVAGVLMLVFVLLGPLKTNVNQSGGRSCFENLSKHEWDTRLAVYSLLVLIFGSLLPSVIMLVCYPLVVRRISMIRTNTAQRAVRVIHTILAITLLCFLPNHVANLLHLLRRMDVIKSCTAANRIYDAKRVTTALVTLNTCLDPVLYYFTTGHFKWRLLKMTWLCGRVESSRDVSTIAVDLEN